MDETPKTQTPKTKTIVSTKQVAQDVTEIKEALVGTLRSPGLVHLFNAFQVETRDQINEIKESVSYVRGQQDKFITVEVLNKHLEPVLPIVQTVTNWKYLISILVGAGTIMGTIITWLVHYFSKTGV